MQESDFFILRTQRTASSCSLNRPVGDPPLAPAAEGDAAAAKWPQKAGFRMSDATPGIVVLDFVENSRRFLMVSPRVKAYFESVLKDKVEYLPFAVINHKGDALDEPYFVVNILDRLDCADAAASKGDPDDLNPGWFDFYEELHLDVKKIPADRRMFRLGTRPSLVLVHRSVKDDIESHKFTGARFVPMGGPEK